MRAKNREINIFNMSLLDILTGMLGAFLFLMLGLIPYYSRAKNAPDPNATPPVNTILNEIVQWSAEGNMSVYLIGPGNQWNGLNTKNAALPRGLKIDPGGCYNNTGWENACSYAHEDNHYLVVYCINGNANPQAYTNVKFLSELIRVESDPKLGKGVTNFAPCIRSSEINLSGARPGVLYGAVWILTNKNPAVKDPALQHDITTQLVKSSVGLPQGVLPSPPPTTTQQRLAPPSYNVPPGFQPHPSPDTNAPPSNGPPNTGPSGSPNTSPSGQPDTAPSDNSSQPSDQPPSDQPAPTPHRSWWSYINPLNWFSSGKK